MKIEHNFNCSLFGLCPGLTTNCSVFEEVSLVIIRNIFSNNFNVIVTQLYEFCMLFCFSLLLGRGGAYSRLGAQNYFIGGWGGRLSTFPT